MANYAYNPTPFSGISTSPWANAVSQMPYLQQVYLNSVAPQDGYNQFVRSVHPSLANEDVMRKLYNTIYSNWTQNSWAAQDSGQTGMPTQGGKNWMEYLRDYNWNHEFAKYTPELRSEGTSNFYRPNVRTITF